MTKIVKKTFIVCLGICIALLLSIFFSAGVNAFAATTQEETNISAEQSETESDTTDEGTTEEEPLATVRQWTGDADDAGKAEYFAENGRDGIVFNSKERNQVGINSAQVWNVNEGITIRFRVTSVPGNHTDVDAWLAFMFQNGTDIGPTSNTPGFKFLFREADPAGTAGAGMEIERFICVTGGVNTWKPALFSFVPMGGNEHYISIVQRTDGNGFLTCIDGVVTDYFDDDDAFMIDDLTQAHITVTAYTDAGKVAECPPWEVEIGAIEPMSETEAWETFGTALLEEEDGVLKVVESPLQSGADSKTFLKGTVNVEKTLEIKLKIDQCPVFTDEFSDAYIGIILSKEEFSTNIGATDALVAVLKLKDRDTLLGNFGLGSMVAGLDQEVDSVKPGDELTIAFGFDENGTAVITLNGTIVGHTNSISANNFLNKEGYISVVTYNGSSPTQCNWAYTIAVSETDNAVPVWQEDGENDDNGGQTPEDPPQGSSCSGSVVGTGTLLAAAAVLFGVFAVLKKKNKENRE